MKTLTPSRLSCLTAAFSLFLLFATACGKEDKGDPTPAAGEAAAPCTLLGENRSSLSGLNDRTATVAYDANGRIASVTYAYGDEPELVDKYERNPAGKISRMQTFKGTEVVWEMVLEYDPQEKWKKVTTGANGGVTVLIAYEYDSKGNIVKTTRTKEERGRTETSVKTYEYTNGNLTNMVVEYGTNGYFVDHFAYEYYLDKPAFPIEYNSVFGLSYDAGTPSKNLVKRATLTRPSEEDFRSVTNYAYKLNGAGMPTRITSSQIDYDGSFVNDVSYDSLVVTRSYLCK
ncbi:hypothetical protein MKJ04_04565 [Pontibacter sp. E15-1]|uniref:hypothetical protein n=1 Tax=Pontibacter sp. E15-1 TaxID=2919918 RepID=UPI001F4FA5D0|nr:hypothetical protein [Pontibacter sp. E15-1]MCJ8164104.1 hypothetical protein [Pontibacter sp. E15-1]